MFVLCTFVRRKTNDKLIQSQVLSNKNFDVMSIGKKIKELRFRNGLTQDELGQKLGITKSAVSNLEKDGSRPSPSTIKKLSEIFGVTLEDLSNPVIDKSPNEDRFEELNSTVDFLKDHIQALMEEKKKLTELLELALKGNFPEGNECVVIRMYPEPIAQRA